MLEVKDIKASYQQFEMDGYLYLHRAIRRDIGNLEKAASRFSSMSEAEFERLTNWFQFYWEMVEIHHVDEDKSFFPSLLARVPELAKALETLTEEHTELHQMVGEVGNSLKQIKTMPRGAEREAALQNLSQRLSRFQELIDRHLVREEEVTIPAISQHFSAKEQKAMGDKIMKSIPVKRLSLLIPWVSSVLTPEEAAAGFKTLPLPIRLMYNLSWKNKYEKFSAVIRV